MAFVDPSAKEHLNAPNASLLEEALKELEEVRDAPVRFMEGGNEGRSVARHTTWRGACRTLTHYKNGTTEDHFAEKGITIYQRSWNDDGALPSPAWHYLMVNPLTIGEPRGPYANGRREMPEAIELDSFCRTLEQIQAIDGCNAVEHEDKPIGEIYADGRLMFLTAYLGRATGYIDINWELLISEPLVAAADPDLLAQIEQQRGERYRAAFGVMLKDRGDQALTECRTKRDEMAIEYANAQEQIVVLDGNIKSYDRQLTYLLDQHDDLTDEMIEQEWNAITANVNVERFTAGQNRERMDRLFGGENGGEAVANPFLKVFTKQLWITNPDNERKMPLGKYEVTMNFGANTLRIHNTTSQQHGDNGGLTVNANDNTRWDHPHVKNGKLCTAQYATAITTLLRDRKLAQMTNMLFSILSTVTLDDNWGRNNILLWERADDELRSTNGWPEWTTEEEQHPMLAQEN